jgi:hypothetical protein
VAQIFLGLFHAGAVLVPRWGRGADCLRGTRFAGKWINQEAKKILVTDAWFLHMDRDWQAPLFDFFSRILLIDKLLGRSWWYGLCEA